jgi:hypothetical protein
MKKTMPAQNRVLSISLLIVIFLGELLQIGCSTVSAIRGEPGKDISSVKPGISREETEKVLGSPTREWITSSNIRYCVYVYDAGIAPNWSDAGAFLTLTIVTAGLIELVEATADHPMRKRFDWDGKARSFKQIAVGYDPHDIIVIVIDNFSDFSVLPPEGREVK